MTNDIDSTNKNQKFVHYYAMCEKIKRVLEDFFCRQKINYQIINIKIEDNNP